MMCGRVDRFGRCRILVVQFVEGQFSLGGGGVWLCCCCCCYFFKCVLYVFCVTRGGGVGYRI